MIKKRLPLNKFKFISQKPAKTITYSVNDTCKYLQTGVKFSFSRLQITIIQLGSTFNNHKIINIYLFHQLCSFKTKSCDGSNPKRHLLYIKISNQIMMQTCKYNLQITRLPTSAHYTCIKKILQFLSYYTPQMIAFISLIHSIQPYSKAFTIL